MKAPSKNISASLRGQTNTGRMPKPVQTGRPSGKLSMTVPGEGGIETAPGMVDERSAVRYAEAMAKQTGR